MRLASLALVFASASLVVACGGVSDEPKPSTGSPAGTSTGTPGSVGTTKPGTDPPKTGITGPAVVYQGDAVGVTNVRGTDMVLGGDNGETYVHGSTSGWWFETHDTATTAVVVIYASPYGTQNVAVELAKFTIE